MSFRVRLEKENFKFSCSHFTIFSADSAEPLHGHNYYVSVELKLSGLDADLGMAFDFNLIKPIIRKVAEELDERVLVPAHSPFLKVATIRDRVIAEHGGKSYDLPASDVKILPLVNITSEELARHFAGELHRGLMLHPASLARMTSIAISIEETRGQSVTFEMTL